MARAAVLLAALVTLALLTVPSLVTAQGPERPVRLGIHHARPRLCLGDEPSQRDLRVLRKAYGVLQVPEERLAWPWFYRTEPSGPTALPGVRVRLDSEALWQQPLVRLLGRHPKLPAQARPGGGPPAPPGAAGPRDQLAAWEDWVARHLPGTHPAALESVVQFVAPAPAEDPFFPSRLAGSRLWPFALPRNGIRPEEQCRDWPAGIALRAAEEPLAYALTAAGPAAGLPGAPFRLHAYRDLRALWRDYFWGRLDAILLEGEDYDGPLARYRASQLGPWGALPGTQQLVLRLRPELGATLGRAGRLALSLALSRDRLAETDGPGRFVAATHFLAPLLPLNAPPPAGEAADPLAWDTLRARRVWLEARQGTPRELPELTLAVLEHPVLERIARRVQAQWSRTLNLSLRVQPLSADQFHRAIAAGRVDLYLDVVDLDDGSLQDLWLESLRSLRALEGPAAPGSPPAWETALRKHLPYLPLLGNLHAVLLRREAPPELLPRVCPGCVPVESPRRPAPEPTEREEPRG
jgi:hypothetical protein